MRITIQALVDREHGEPPTTVALGAVERNSGSAPSAGLGLFIREPHDLLQQLQSVVLQEQVTEFLKSAACCKAVGLLMPRRAPRYWSDAMLEFLLQAIADRSNGGLHARRAKRAAGRKCVAQVNLCEAIGIFDAIPANQRAPWVLVAALR